MSVIGWIALAFFIGAVLFFAAMVRGGFAADLWWVLTGRWKK